MMVSVEAALHRQGRMIGDTALEVGSLMSMEMVGFWNTKGQEIVLNHLGQAR